MQWLSSILQTLQVISSLLVIVLVLLQQGKGADMGAAFGSGSAGSVFGAAGAANFLSRATKWAAIVFFVTTGGLAWVAHHPSGSPLDSGLMSGFMSSEPDKSLPATGVAVPNVGSSVPGDVPSVPAESADNAASSDNTAGDVSNALPSLGSSSDNSVPSVPSPSN